MGNQVDINKVVRQHLEMEQFFSGFTIKSTTGAIEPQEQEDKTTVDRQTDHTERSQMVAEKTATLEKIAGEVRQCRQCGLGSSRTNAVPGEGHADARIMFVGEAPGGDEDVQGRPFVGRAGQLLDKIINACGLQRQDVFIGNILKCRPPDNRDPRAEEILTGAYHLLQERAEKIDDQELRRSYLENVSYHREIVAEFRRVHERV